MSDPIARIKKHSENWNAVLKVFLHGKDGAVSDGKLVALPNVFWMTESQVQKKTSVQQKSDFPISFLGTKLSKEAKRQCRKTLFDGQNERDQHLTIQPLHVPHVEERKITLRLPTSKK